MCGIVGEIGPKACQRKQLLQMMGMLTHRGPDEAGFLIAPGVAFGHLRLSIIDLETGQQPMTTHDGRYWVVFNGEIYNHIELRKELEELGQTFLTRSDTEVLLNAYRAWGPACLERFNGQWAFALWDRQENSFFLARDRWGVRPLFYSVLPDGQTLLFSSEIKAILVDARVDRAWNPGALRNILSCWVSEADLTPLQAVRSLPPGWSLQVKNGKISARKWWEVNYSPDVIEWNRSLKSWCEEVSEVLSDACAIRLRADVPVGAYLSGGLDSSIIALLARNHHDNVLNTFSISFTDSDFDESAFQRVMADYLGTGHQCLSITRDLIAESFENAIWHTETPIYRTAPIPMMYLSRLVRTAGIKVVLTGEGADEIFGGYDQFKEDKIRRFWAKNPASQFRKRLLERIAATVPGTGTRNRDFWYAFFQKRLTETDAPGYSHFIRWYNGMSLWPMLSEGFSFHSHRPVSQSHNTTDPWIDEITSSIPVGFKKWPALSKAQYWETRQLLSGYLLSSQGDRMAMANSIESRYPFLDVRVYELARRMPPNIKLRALQEKYVLKRAFRGILPETVVRRVKNPYRAPDSLALYHGNLRDRVLASLSGTSVRRHGLFREDAVSKLLNRLKTANHSSARDTMALVLIYSSHVFHDLFVEGRMIPEPIPRLRVCTEIQARNSPGPSVMRININKDNYQLRDK
jgi:asparagine synthase (glutamine-hydrolysing)